MNAVESRAGGSMGSMDLPTVHLRIAAESESLAEGSESPLFQLGSAKRLPHFVESCASWTVTSAGDGGSGVRQEVVFQRGVDSGRGLGRP
jgi:hypothetical protein